WQGDYRFTKPVRLPKGSTLHLQFSYDNSTNNPVNPHQPPQRVVYGERSSDEMCELGLQVLARQTNDLRVLQEAVARHRNSLIEDDLRQRLAFNPDDAEALTRLGINLWEQDRLPEARTHLERAIKVRPDFAEAHYNEGIFLRFNGQPAEARQEFETALRLDARFPGAHQQLGFAFAALGQLVRAERSFEKALELEPADTVARDGLAELRQIIKSRQRSN
ncbi:MAG TPA: tetratricopeptide repeat protein, partial [Candidatus Eisenbacteria bacterium]|nr:tetratricopeptide repeat protein [Candidatus Eisenbacteria bacterium]